MILLFLLFGVMFVFIKKYQAGRLAQKQTLEMLSFLSANNTVVKSHIIVIHFKGSGQSSLLKGSSHSLVMYRL